jgi:hypothetical protein
MTKGRVWNERRSKGFADRFRHTYAGANNGAPLWSCGIRHRFEGEACGIPHIAKNERDAPNFLYAALERTACAALFKESRMKFREPTKLHRKSGMWGTRLLW